MEEHENKERKLKLNIIILTVTVLIAISLLFETGKEKLLESTTENMLPIINSLFGELTLLGFIGLSLFLVFKMEWIEVVSEHIYGEPAKIKELGEAVHMVLFLVMVIFLVQAVAFARLGERVQSKWKLWESSGCDRPSARTCRAAKAYLGSSYSHLLLVPRFSEPLQMMLHAITKKRFVVALQLENADFEFASYLSIALGRTLSEIVEVPVSTWLGLEAVLLLFWGMDNLLSNNARVVLWIAVGWCLSLLVLVVHAKVRLVMLVHVAPMLDELLREIEQRQQGAAFQDDENQLAAATTTVATTQQYRGRNIKWSPSQKGLVVPAEMDAAVPVVAAVDRSKETREEQIGRIMQQSSKSPPPTSASLADRAAPVSPVPVPKVVAFAPEPTTPPPPGTSPAGILSPPPPAGMVSLGQGSCTHTDDAIPPAAFGLFFSGWIGRCEVWCRRLLFGSPQTRKLHRGESMDKNFASNFWFGSHHKAHFTLDVIRSIVLVFSIYIAVFSLVYVPQLVCVVPDEAEEEENEQVLAFTSFPQWARFLIVVLGALPPCMSMQKMSMVLQDFAVAANVESLQNLRFIEQVLRRQKTVAAFQALKVVTFLRKPDFISAMLTQTRARGDSICDDATASVFRRGHSTAAECSMNEDELAERAEVARAVEEQQRRSWRQIFDIFDVDHEGSIDRAELKALLSKFSANNVGDGASTATTSVNEEELDLEFDKIIELLDADGSGEVSFDEFFEFGLKLERHVAQNVDPHDMIQEMFNVIDDDHGGTITVQELHATMVGFGQVISIDDVYNIIKDIDDDGNGALDIHEFHLLLSRIGCEFPTSKASKTHHH